jgi:tetratricopeptide (TPR) repeat protein
MMYGKAEAGILLISLALIVAAAAAPATPALIAEVQTALDRGDAQHAVNLADEALREKDISPSERGRLQLYHGLAEELLGATDAATRDFTAALNGGALPPEDRTQALLQRGFLHDGQSRLAEAVADYSAVIAQGGPGMANALNNRANIYRRQNKFTEARRDYQAALSAGGKAQYAWYGFGQMAEAEGDVAGARGFYAKAVAADPGYVLAAERLRALGGPPEGAIASAQAPVVLKPPVQAAAKAPQEASVTLRPPGQKQVASLPPQTRARPAPENAPAADTSLRPALDQSGSTKGEVQLGAWRSEAEARTGWEKARAQAGDILGGLQPRVVTADLPGKGRYYRLRVTPAAGQSRDAFCGSLTAKGVACFPARN